MKKLLWLIPLITTLAFCQTSEDDFVNFKIPNYTHNWYSGYFNITLTKSVHYIFLESQNDRDNDPLILWVSGGPGCSSLFSMFYEVGPFRFVTPLAESLNVTKEAWNNRANLLFLETPGNVGFSVGPTNTNDDFATMDHLSSLSYFFARYPTLKKNDLYLAGHGYAGILAPKLAATILDRNQSPFFTKINFKGLLLGNPCTAHDECYVGTREKPSYYHYEYLFNHNFMTEKHWDHFRGSCAMGYETELCGEQRQVLDKLWNSTNSSMYNVYAKCYKSDKISVAVPNPGCEDDYGLTLIMNEADLQNALHVNRGSWSVCNANVRSNYNMTGDVFNIYKDLIKAKKYKIFIYSGDLSAYVPVGGTLKWIARLREQLDIPIRKTWRQWWVPGKHPHEDQVGGMVWELEGLTVASVKGSGFMIGREKPVALYEILDAFLNDKRLPLTSTMKGLNKPNAKATV